MPERTPFNGTPEQIDRQFKAFELHIRGKSMADIADVLGVERHTISDDIRLEYARRGELYGSDSDAWVERAYHKLEALQEINFGVLSQTQGYSKNGHEVKNIIAAILAQAQIRGFMSPLKVDVSGQIEGLPQVFPDLPSEFIVRLMYAIGDARIGGDPESVLKRVGGEVWALADGDGSGRDAQADMATGEIPADT